LNYSTCSGSADLSSDQHKYLLQLSEMNSQAELLAMVREQANSLWGSDDFDSPATLLYDARGQCTGAGKRTECPGWRYLTSLESCPTELRLPLHPALLARRASVRAADAALLDAADEEDDSHLYSHDHAFGRLWQDLTFPERAAAFALGACASSWDDGTADRHQYDEWTDLTTAERAAASVLGFNSAGKWQGWFLGPDGAQPVCECCAEEPYAFCLIYSHESQPVDYCRTCFQELTAEARVGLYETTVRCRSAWYASHPPP
jgi:hypothetical protein